jgi:hypothetical protein
MTDAVITSEPRTYGAANPEHSWFQDVALSCVNQPGSDQARARLRRHAEEVDVEIRARSREGLRAQRERQFRALRAEQRVGGATSSTIAGFTTPVWLTELWAAYRSPDRSFANQTFRVPLSPYGLQVNVPSFSSPANAIQQAAENQGDGSVTPAGADLQQPVTTQLGSVVLSQQLHDRGGASGLGFDQIVGLQLKSQLDAAVDIYVINQALAGASTITDNTAYSNANFYADIAKAREGLTDTAGVRLRATHVFSTSDLYSFVSRQVDTSNRPIFLPDRSAEPWSNLAEHGDSAGDGWLGHVLPGNLAWFSDDNIPASGTNTQIIVSRPQEVVTFEAEPIVYSYEQTYANSLAVVVGLREYVAAVARFPKAHSIITGTAYPLTAV